MSDPKPADPRRRVYRGGSWNYFVPWWVRAASRHADGPADRNYYIGFRCARGGCERKVKP